LPIEARWMKTATGTRLPSVDRTRSGYTPAPRGRAKRSRGRRRGEIETAGGGGWPIRSSPSRSRCRPRPPGAAPRGGHPLRSRSRELWQRAARESDTPRPAGRDTHRPSSWTSRTCVRRGPSGDSPGTIPLPSRAGPTRPIDRHARVPAARRSRYQATVLRRPRSKSVAERNPNASSALLVSSFRRG
jgi:hypothetical protein